MSIAMKLDGMAELHEALKELGAQASVKVMRAAGRKAMKRVLDAARARAPVDTGVLRDSIILSSQRLDGTEDAGVVAVGLKVKRTKNSRTSGAASLIRSAPTIGGNVMRDASWRWHFVEKGTSKMAAKPFFRPAMDSNAEAVVGDFTTELRKGIERAQRRGKR